MTDKEVIAKEIIDENEILHGFENVRRSFRN